MTMTDNRKTPVLLRSASLTDAEAYCLRSLLIDREDDLSRPLLNNNNDKPRLTLPMLLASLPPTMERPKPRRLSIQGLWSAHKAGVTPQQLVRNASKQQKESVSGSGNVDASMTSEGDSIQSDLQVRPDLGDQDSSSWDSQDDANHLEYDAWEVLKDEYAQDFGFVYSSLGSNDDDDTCFDILGTSANDKSAQPHVLSPPLMDALEHFLPTKLQGQNFWLRYSLVRDGASLDTLKRYVRASQYTILAIETPRGEVFGSFTSAPWRTNYGFYGSAPAFVWKMRHGRRTKCISLFDQAQMESEIDVYMSTTTADENYIQLCRHDVLGVGGDEQLEADAALADQHGFAIGVDENLQHGTTSFCKIFHNPCLVGTGDKSSTFEVAGLEVWTFTPAQSEEIAEQLEMTKCK